jgi:Na+/H+-dicarboxylate symporter
MSLTVRILIGLVLGLAVGIGLDAAGLARDDVVGAAQTVGALWLDLLRMTIIPLVFSLLVTSIASAAGAARAGGATARALLLFAVLLLAASAFAAVVTPLILQLWPVSSEAAQVLRSGADASKVPPNPPVGEWLKSLIPSNPVGAAAEGALAPLVLFAVLFGLAVTRTRPDQVRTITGFFEAVADAMLVIVGWVLWLAPFGVFALSLALGARTGLDAVGVLGQYVAVVSIVLILLTLLLYPVAAIAGRRSPLAFGREMLPVQTLAFSTQSSLACLPAMVLASERLMVPERVGGLVIPMAVSLFRITSPAGNIAVAFYVAELYGLQLGLPQIIAGVVVAAVVSVGLVGLPSALTFFTALGPIFLTMGIPLEVLPLLLAVESLPDIWRTVGNVTGHVAASTVIAEHGGAGADSPGIAAGAEGLADADDRPAEASARRS